MTKIQFAQHKFAICTITLTQGETNIELKYGQWGLINK